MVGDTAIVVGRMTADLTVQGTRKTIDNLALAVWTKDGGEWRLLAYAPTRCPADQTVNVMPCASGRSPE